MSSLNLQQVMSPSEKDGLKEKRPIYKGDRFGVWKQRMKEKLQGIQCDRLLERPYSMLAAKEFTKAISEWIAVDSLDDFGRDWGKTQDGQCRRALAQAERSNYYRTAAGLVKIRSEKAKIFDKWQSRSMFTLQKIRECLPATLKATVDKDEEPHKAMESIQQKWNATNSTEHLARLQNEFDDLVLGKGTVPELINEIWEISKERELLKDTVTEATKSAKLLRAMPEPYRTTVDTLRAMNATWNQIVTKLCDKEIELRKLSPSKQANMVVSGEEQELKIAEGGTCYECGGCHYRADCSKFKARKKLEETMRRKNGSWVDPRERNKHRKIKKKDEEKGKNGGSNMKKFAQLAQAMNVLGIDGDSMEEFFALQAINKSDSNYPVSQSLAYVDSACTDVMCGTRDLFTDLVALPNPERIYMADKQTYIYAVGTGTVTIKTLCPERPYLSIGNVLYAPKIGNNLISVKNLTLEGLSVNFTPEGGQIRDNKNRLLLKMIEKGNMYYVTLAVGNEKTRAYNSEVIITNEQILDPTDELGNPENELGHYRDEKIKSTETKDKNEKKNEKIKSTETRKEKQRPVSKEETALWHRRLGHIGRDAMDRLPWRPNQDPKLPLRA